LNNLDSDDLLRLKKLLELALDADTSNENALDDCVSVTLQCMAAEKGKKTIRYETPELDLSLWNLSLSVRLELLRRSGAIGFNYIKLSINPNKEIEIEVHDKPEAFKQMGDIIKKFTH